LRVGEKNCDEKGEEVKIKVLRNQGKGTKGFGGGGKKERGGNKKNNREPVRGMKGLSNQGLLLENRGEKKPKGEWLETGGGGEGLFQYD